MASYPDDDDYQPDDDTMRLIRNAQEACRALEKTWEH